MSTQTEPSAANSNVRVGVTGASGIGGVATCHALLEAGFTVRMADIGAPPADLREHARVEFVRCDTRTPADCHAFVEGCTAVVHLAAWHCAHNPPVSDDTIWAVNTDGTFNILQACHAEGIKAFVYASSMAYGWGSIYGVTKVTGEDLCRCFAETTGAGVVMLRYHDFVPKPYLAFGEKLLRNGVDARDVATSNVASVRAALRGGLGLFRTVVHTDHGMPPEVVTSFRELGPDWCESRLPGAKALIEKYALELPEQVEQHDLSEAKARLNWAPQFGFLEFLRDLRTRDERGDNVRELHAPGRLPAL